MAEIKKLVDKNNVQFFPVTHINAVVGSDNTSLSEELASKQDTIEAVQVNIDGTSGTPSGSASMSGNTLQFSFSGIKGNDGATGPQGPTGPAGVTSAVVNVDNTSGTPSATATVQNGVLTINISGIKGEQGNPGSSQDYPFELENSLSGGTNKALTAEQGKVLDGKVTQLSANVIEFPYERVDGYYLNVIGNRVERASSSYFVFSIPNVLKTIRLKGTAVGGSTSSIVFTEVNDFSEGCLSKYTFTGNIDEVLEVPEGTKYILVDRFNDTEILNLLEPVYELPVALNIEADFTIDGFINGEGEYRNSGVYKITDYIPIYSGYLIKGKVYNALIEGDDYNTESYVVFFNKEKEIIELVKSETTGLSSFSVVAPSDAYFVRLSTKTSELSNSYAEIFSNLGSITREVHRIDGITSGLESTQEITYSEGGYIDTDGIIHDAAATSWAHTGYLRINPNDVVNASAAGAPGTTLLIAFYNSNREFIQGVAPTLNQQIENVKAVAPANSAYVVVGSRIASISPAPSGNLIKSNYVSQQNLQNTEKRLQDNIDDVYKDINLYRNNLHKPLIFTNKTAAFFGDSVTHGVSSDANGVHNPSEDWNVLDCYRKVLCKKANLIGTTYAVSGSFICDLEDAQSSILNMVKNNISANSNYDFIFIAGGINDFWTRKPLGQLGDSSYNTFYGALENMCDHLDSVLAGKTTEVIFLTPINYSHTRDIGAGESLNTYRNAIFEIATMHGYNVIDTSVIGFPNKKILNLYKQTMIYDGVHPTIQGHKMMGENLYSILL